MIKTYKKIATIQAEQFDGSQEMMDKYKVIERVWSSGITEYEIETIEDNEELWVTDWIATGIHGEHWIISDYIMQGYYEEVNHD